MIHPNNHLVSHQRRPPRFGGLACGFALVVTLSLMVLLTLIVVGLLSLASVALRTSGNDLAQQQAQANARLALMLAIGELQRTLGPDTRVSANARILEKSGESVSASLAQITGVWEAWRPSSDAIGNYAQRKSGLPQALSISTSDGLPQPMGGFHRWLVSTGDPTACSNIYFPKTGTLVNPVELVRSPGPSQPGVLADRVSLCGPTRSHGALAWAVFDEGQKIAASLGPPSPTGTPLDRLANQQTPGWNHVAAWGALASLGAADRAKLISYGTTQLAGNQDPGRFSYDMTASSSGLLTDVTLGKLRSDLSLLFSRATLPTEYSTRYLYSGTNTPLANAPSRGSHPYVWPSPDPRWSLLYKFYHIPDDYRFNREGNNVSMTIDFNSIPDRLNSAGTAANPSYNQLLKLSPVISKAQFFFSMTFCKDSQLTSDYWPNNGGTSTSRGASDICAQADVIIDPVITLWNPYDVAIKVPEFRVFLYRLPLKFRFDVSNTAGLPPILRHKSGFSGFTDYVDLVKPAGNVPELAYPLLIKPPIDKTFIEMYPGEHLVCSVQDFKTSANIVDGAGPAPPGEVLMRPGWYAPNPGGTSQAGGISSENLFRDESGGTGAEYLRNDGSWTSTPGLPVRANDRIAITVEPLTANRGNFVTLGKQPVDFYLRYGKAAPLSGAGGERATMADFGAIELNYGSHLDQYLKSFSSNSPGAAALPSYPIQTSDLTNAPVDDMKSYKDASGQYRGAKMKKPFLVASIHLKSLVRQDTYRSKFPGRAWIYNNPTALYASNGLGNQNESQASHQYEFSLEPLAGTWRSGVPEVNLNTVTNHYNGYGGPSPSADYGRPFAPFISIPRAHATSLAQLRHAPLNQSGKLPLQAQVLANSFAHPLLPAEIVIDAAKGYLDHSFLANKLFDQTFFSSARSGQDIVDLARSGTPLINPRMIFYGTPNKNLLTGNNNHNYSAASLLINGAFNVNSTSENAWMAFLTAMNDAQIPCLTGLDKTTLGTIANPDHEAHVSRYSMPLDQGLGDALDVAGAANQPAWQGYRKLGKTQIETLARMIVAEVKARGPFQSIAEFINRRAEKSPLGQMGALQAAIEQAGINDAAIHDKNSLMLKGTESGSEDYANPVAAQGSTLTGTPGYLLQADLLNSMAPFIAVRSDTFKIRAYGEATDPSGKSVLASACCEAVVQRLPDYVDARTNTASDHPGTDSPTALSKVNRAFGRRFQIVAFRWLNPQDR